MIFDSLQTGYRARVVATLREYLQCEYKAKISEERKFTKDNMKGACPKVPQQPNFSDCGLFALQYVESFFKSPLSDFNLPITNLKKWFPSEVMRNKRSEIAKIIRDLAEKQNKDKKISFPQLTFTPESGSGYTDDEDSDEKSVKPLMKTPKFFVKTSTPSSTTTRVICLTSSNKSLTLTPSKNSAPNNTKAPNSGQLMIQRKKGKIEYFTVQQGKKTPNKKPLTVLIPKLTSGPGEKVVKKELNGPLVNYSDSSSNESKSEALENMEVDDDGAPKLPNPAGASNKRSLEEKGPEDTSKKAKVDNDA